VPAPTDAFAGNLRFLRALMARPKHVGAIAPSSRALARAMALQIDPEASGPVLELGPGTGVITQAILARGIVPARLTLVEYDSDMAGFLAGRFQGVEVIHGDAFDLTRTLGGKAELKFSAIVSGLPLLNFPLARRRHYLEGVCRLLSPGSPLIQFSYGVQPPVMPPPGHSVMRAALVWANLPPARVWVYRKA
jgi:phosphatidylethanolamine/phosphatidyl-N-methylethanolamine N-methyltransferase